MLGLVAQVRRAAVSVTSNIAEGYTRRSPPDKARILNIAHASLEECRYQLLLAEDLGCVRTSDARALADEVGRMLDAYARTVVRTRPPGS